MPCCGAEPAGAPPILTQRAGKLSLPSGMVLSQEAERRGLARHAADGTNLGIIAYKTPETSILTKLRYYG